jgi:hypothetical protein
VPRVRYLGSQWLAAVAEAVASSERLQALAGDHEIGLTQVVTGTPHGDVTYHLQVDGGRAAIGTGPADPEHVRFTERWETAVAVATGAVNPQEPFLNGDIAFTGDHERLVRAGDLFAEMDAAFESVRELTDYD